MIKEFNISDTGKSEAVNTEPVIIPTVKPESQITEVELSKGKNKFHFKVLIFPIVASLSLIGIAGFYYFGIYKVKAQPLNKVLSFNQDFIASSALSNMFKNGLALLSTPQEPKTEESPLNGMLFTKTQMDILKTRRPVAVMTNNHSDARPLSGTNSADVVFETNAEGGITRLMTIYWSAAPEKVGPVRSLRQYYLEWASEYDPLLIRDGCASSDDPRTNACWNVYSFGIKDLATTGAWRWNDGRRFAPHNEYNSVNYAWEYAVKMDWDSFPKSFESWQFKTDAEISKRGEKTQVKLIFSQGLPNGGLYDVIWTYDQSTNTYLRNVGGQADIDQETNSQVYAKDIVVQEVSMIQSGDDKAHLIITTIGQGKSTYLMDGKISYGTWKKTSRTDRTTYYDSGGKEMAFNRGRVWIEVIGTSDGKFAIIEQ